MSSRVVRSAVLKRRTLCKFWRIYNTARAAAARRATLLKRQPWQHAPLQKPLTTSFWLVQVPIRRHARGIEPGLYVSTFRRAGAHRDRGKMKLDIRECVWLTLIHVGLVPRAAARCTQLSLVELVVESASRLLMSRRRKLNGRTDLQTEMGSIGLRKA